MFAYALVVGIVLSGQLRAADQRYPPPPITGQPTTDSAAAAGANPTGSGLLPFGNPAAPANGGTSASATPSEPGGSTSPFRSPTTGAAPPRTLSPLDSSNPAPVNGLSGSAPAAFEVAPNTLGNASAATQPGVGLKPSAMMRAMLSAPSGSQLRGQPLALVEVVAGARTRGEQTQRVEAYWDLCSSVADYYLGLREQEELRKLRTYVQRVGPTWQQAESALSVRVGTSQRAALASQLRLASFMGRDAGNLPLPADTPHCASYLTHFDQVFPNGAPAEARELATLLPLRYTELKDAGAAVTRAEDWLDSVARNDSDGTGSLRALELLALQRRAFVQIARDYNRRIARFSELATPGQVSAERLTGMLIKSTYASTATKSAAPLVPLNRQSSTGSAPPRTFIEGANASASPISNAAKRDDGVQPASATQPKSPMQSTSRKERSLLVPSR